MLYGVIDVGSNSVRLMISDGERTLYKKIKTTRLAEGLIDGDLTLKPAPVDRTVQAVLSFIDHAKSQKVDKIMVFATAAVRQATNGDYFVQKVFDASGVRVFVVSGEQEAFLGFAGALNGKDGVVVDIGGASTEIISSFNQKINYSKSINVGAVRLNTLFQQDKVKIENYLDEKLLEFGSLPNGALCAIGGTATTIASLVLELEPYDPNKVDGFVLKISYLKSLVDKLFSLSIEDRKKLKGMYADRAEVIAGGTLELYMIMQMLGVTECTISERDNLEGYLMLKRR